MSIICCRVNSRPAARVTMTDPVESGDVGVAVSAGAAGGAVWLQEAFAFVKAEGLDGHSGELGGDGDAVDAGGAVTGRDRGWGCSGDPAGHRIFLSASSCVGLIAFDIPNL